MNKRSAIFAVALAAVLAVATPATAGRLVRVEGDLASPDDSPLRGSEQRDSESVVLLNFRLPRPTAPVTRSR